MPKSSDIRQAVIEYFGKHRYTIYLSDLEFALANPYRIGRTELLSELRKMDTDGLVMCHEWNEGHAVTVEPTRSIPEVF